MVLIVTYEPEYQNCLFVIGKTDIVFFYNSHDLEILARNSITIILQLIADVTSGGNGILTWGWCWWRGSLSGHRGYSGSWRRCGWGTGSCHHSVRSVCVDDWLVSGAWCWVAIGSRYRNTLWYIATKRITWVGNHRTFIRNIHVHLTSEKEGNHFTGNLKLVSLCHTVIE